MFFLTFLFFPWWGVLPFIWINLNPHNPRMPQSLLSENVTYLNKHECLSSKGIVVLEKFITMDRLWSEKLHWASESGKLKIAALSKANFCAVKSIWLQRDLFYFFLIEFCLYQIVDWKRVLVYTSPRFERSLTKGIKKKG